MQMTEQEIAEIAKQIAEQQQPEKIILY